MKILIKKLISRDNIVATLRMLLVAVLTTVIVVGGVVLFFGDQTKQEQDTFAAIREANELTVKLNKAIGCELGVPSKIVKDENGNDISQRDADLLRLCWTAEGLTPPEFLRGEN